MSKKNENIPSKEVMTKNNPTPFDPAQPTKLNKLGNLQTILPNLAPPALGGVAMVSSFHQGDILPIYPCPALWSVQGNGYITLSATDGSAPDYTIYLNIASVPTSAAIYFSLLDTTNNNTYIFKLPPIP